MYVFINKHIYIYMYVCMYIYIYIYMPYLNAKFGGDSERRSGLSPGMWTAGRLGQGDGRYRMRTFVEAMSFLLSFLCSLFRFSFVCLKRFSGYLFATHYGCRSSAAGGRQSASAFRGTRASPASIFYHITSR